MSYSFNHLLNKHKSSLNSNILGRKGKLKKWSMQYVLVSFYLQPSSFHFYTQKFLSFPPFLCKISQCNLQLAHSVMGTPVKRASESVSRPSFCKTMVQANLYDLVNSIPFTWGSVKSITIILREINLAMFRLLFPDEPVWLKLNQISVCVCVCS